MDIDGRELAHATGPGVAEIPPGAFPRMLRKLVGEWSDGFTPIILGGMVGSRQGWRETSYLRCPAALSGLSASLVAIDTEIGPGWLVPGMLSEHADGTTDVLRGEELQLLGVRAQDGIFILPGTHSKWVSVTNGIVTDFSTFMTGELFEILCRHSLLGRLMAEGEDPDAFNRGVDVGLRDPALCRGLFSARTEALFGRIPDTGVADYVSGLLIGAEIGANQAKWPQPVGIIAVEGLGARYRCALARAGCVDVVLHDGTQAAAQGLHGLSLSAAQASL